MKEIKFNKGKILHRMLQVLIKGGKGRGMVNFMKTTIFMLFMIIGMVLASEMFVKVDEIGLDKEYARKGVLLRNGTVVYFWERTRDPTDQEKEIRAKWFDEKWEIFQKEAETKGTLTIYSSPVAPFLSGVTKSFSILAKQAMEISFMFAKQHFVNQPVVTQAGLKIRYPHLQEKDIFIDMNIFYGQEEWLRTPCEEINLRVSPDSKFIVLETIENYLNLCEVGEEGLIPRAKMSACSPIVWSPSGEFMLVAKNSDKSVFEIYETQSLSKIREFTVFDKLDKKQKKRIC